MRSSRPPVSAPDKKRIVVIEDVDDSRELIKVLLERKGFQVFTFGTGLEGVEGIKLHRPDIAVVAIGLPDISGYEVRHAVQTEREHQPYMIALTGYGQQTDRDRVFGAGFDKHLVKPLEVDLLIRVLAGAAEAELPDT